MDKLREFRLSEEAEARLNDRDALAAHAQAGGTLKELAGFSEESMQRLYRGAHSIFHQERFADAADAFVFLVTLDPYRHNYWLGLGMSEQALGHFDEALAAYSMAVLTDFKVPTAHFYAGKCYYALNEIPRAGACFDLAIAFSLENPKYDKVKRLAQDSKEFMAKAHPKIFQQKVEDESSE